MGTMSLKLSEPLIMRFGARRTLIPGLVVIAVGLALFTRAPVHGSYAARRAADDDPAGRRHRQRVPGADEARDVGRHAGRRGPGVGPGQHDRAGRRRAGLAVVATLAATRTHHLLASGSSHAAALTGGYQLAFTVGAGLIVAALAVALTVLEPERAVAAHAHGETAAEQRQARASRRTPRVVGDGRPPSGAAGGVARSGAGPSGAAPRESSRAYVQPGL